MTRRLLLLALLAGCAGDRAMTPPPLRSLVLLPPANHTSDALVVAGSSLLERYAIRTERVTVADVVAIALRDQFERNGMTVIPTDSAAGDKTPTTPEAAAEIAHRSHVDAPTLFVAIDRWEPDNPTHPAFVIVAVDATLIEPATGRVLWHRHRAARPVVTPGAVTSGAAHEIAARAIAAELLDGWPVPPAP